MQLKNSFIIFLMFVGTALISLGLFTNTFTQKKVVMLSFSKGDSFEKLWKRVDSCQAKGLTETALQVVDEIYTKAKSSNNAAQFVKAVLHRMKFESFKEEFSIEKTIFKLQEEISQANFPIKPVLQSVLADAYWQYFQNNRWKFYNRTTTVNFKNDDFETWDLTTITNAIIVNYKASLQNEDSLKRTKIDIYDDVLTKGTKACREWRPTLYDFLAHRALNFFMNSVEADITRPAERFTINSDDYLKTYDSFVGVEITNPSDSLETKFYALKLLQDLTRFHINDKNPEALIDVELLRLDYINRNSQNPKKDTLFLHALKSLQQKFIANQRVTEIYYNIASIYSVKTITLEDTTNKWSKKIAKEICEEAIAKYPDSYGAIQCKNLIESLKSQSMKLLLEDVNEPNKPFRALVESKNINKIYFKIVETTPLELRKITRSKYGTDLYRAYMKLPEVKSFSQTLIDDGDFHIHNTEIKIPELEVGYYVILSSLSQDFNLTNNITTCNTFAVSNIASIERKNEQKDSYDIYTLHRTTGEAMPDVSAQVWFENYDYKLRDYVIKKGPLLKTNEIGYLNAGITKTTDDRSFYIEYIKENDHLFNNNSFYNYKSYDAPESYITSAYVFTDRGIYRPGQTIYFKSIVLETIKGNKPRIKPNYPITVSFYDVNSQLISSQELVTNEFGSITGSFTAPQNGLNGQMEISTAYGQTFISVEEYKRPKFETEFLPVKGSFKLNDEVTVNGVAKGYAGNLIDGAKVTYRVTRNVNFPYWYWWYRPYHSTSETEIVNGELLTSDTGSYSITFKALPDESVSKESYATFSYKVTADVTDINGESHEATTYITVGYQAIQLNILSSSTIDVNSVKPLEITSTNLNGVAEGVKGKFAIYKLKQPNKVFRKRLWAQPDRYSLSKEEYYKAFPTDLYEDELNKYKWERETKVIDRSFNTSVDTKYDLSAEFKTLPPGVYVVEAECKDKFGENIKAYQYITLFNKNNQIIPEQIPDWFHASNSIVEPGNKFSFIQASAYQKTNYLFEIEHQDKIIQSSIQQASMKTQQVDILEAYRGNVVLHTTFVRDNRFYTHNTIVNVPYTNKELDIQFETFRNKLLPGQTEEWKLVFKDRSGEKTATELVASMYDASLDAFTPTNWYFNPYQTYYSQLNWGSFVGRSAYSTQIAYMNQSYTPVPYRRYDALNYFGLHFYGNRYYLARGERGGYDEETTILSKSAPISEGDKYSSAKKEKNLTSVVESAFSGVVAVPAESEALPLIDADAKTGEVRNKDNKNNTQEPKVRSNFNETAFFFPQLQTNEKGEIVIKFTVPESLTKWKFMGLAHTKDLKFGQFEKEVITQKELMVQPNAPRFFREGDQMVFISKVSNLSDKNLNGNIELRLYDALTEKDITNELQVTNAKITQPFSVKKGLSVAVDWALKIPLQYSAIKYKIIARADNYSDGEEMVIPVLTNRMLVTESMPLPIRGKQTKEFSFEKFIQQNNHSTTLKNHSYTLEFTANPAWYAIQSLPYLMEYPYECAEQTFARYYANSLASYVVNSKPKIKAVFDAWRTSSPDAFLSNLEKNQELKSLLLEETPWVMQAKNESENKKRVALLFDLNKMSYEQDRAFKKLLKKQSPNGGFVWFDGGPDDWYITQHIITGFSHLDKLGVIKARENGEVWKMITKAVEYCDNRMREEFEWVKKYDPEYKIKNHLSYMAVQYLYMRSNFMDIDLKKRNNEHFNYYKKQEQTYWLKNNRYMQAMIALNLHRYKDTNTPKDILKSLKQNSINSEEMGMYWKENYGFYWYEAPIEMQALMIEAFDEINNDTKTVDDLKTWLVKSKQTQHWGTTKATTDAVYALLLKGTDWLSTEPNVDITVGNYNLNPKTDKSLKVEPGTGYFKKVWNNEEIKPESMGKIKIEKRDEGVSYGSVYWQYFEQLDKITPHETPLKIKKQLFLQKNTKAGEVIEPITDGTKLKLGDKIKVRIELRVDRDMSYVHMKDMRAAGFEPTNVISAYKYQDGLGYYESTRDAATNFFFSYLNKGTYVFEYSLVVSHYGDFSNGITTIQCMYAPEFTSHSEGVRVKVTK